MQPLMDYATLFTLAEKTTAIAQPCTCTAKALLGWEGWPVTLREAQLRQIGTLVQFEEEEATLDEYHPQGTSYWSVEAPIAPGSRHRVLPEKPQRSFPGQALSHR